MLEMKALNYNYNDFDFISEENLRNHYEVLYKGYVTNYNKVLDDLKLARETGNYANIKGLEKNLAFQGAGAVLHELFFENITPKKSSLDGTLKSKIEVDFGSADAFKEQFINNLTNIEGSGWGILGYSKSIDKLIILQAEKHQDQTIWDFIPLLVIDIWEHAYYLDFITNKKGYAEKMFEHINWEVVQNRFNKL